MDSLSADQIGYGICTLPLIPGRKEPKESSEMVTQILFGEPYGVLHADEKWLLVRNSIDGYEFWMDRKMHTECSQNDHDSAVSSKEILREPVTYVKNIDSGESLLLSMGSRLKQLTNSGFSLLGERYNFLEDHSDSKSSSLELLAKKFLNSPYLWGGKSVFGVDCSGYVQIIMSCFGIDLPRDASLQAEHGEQVGFRDLINPGDLVFFDNAEGRITHVGIALDQARIIHASGKVRIDRLDHEGIFNEETKSYTHKTRMIKRVLNLGKE